MNDLSDTLAAKSDQLTADDLIGRALTIQVTAVTKDAGSEQPVSISFDGDGGKPFRPCKIMRRLLVQCWGRDGNAYVGRSMTLYRDPDVMFGALKVGGIRISHLSHIDGDTIVPLTEKKGRKKGHKVRPLAVRAPAATAATPAASPPDAPPNRAEQWLAALTRALAKCELSDDVHALRRRADVQEAMERGGEAFAQRISAAFRDALARTEPAPECAPPDPFDSLPDDGWPGPDVPARVPA